PRVDPRRDRVPEADPRRQERQDGEGDRDAGASGGRGAPRPPRLPRAQGQGGAAVASGRRNPRAARALADLYWHRACHGKRLDRLAEALQLESADRGCLDDLLDLGEHALPDDDLPRLRGVAEARGEIEDAADRAVVVAPLEADPPDRGITEC